MGCWNPIGMANRCSFGELHWSKGTYLMRILEHINSKKKHIHSELTWSSKTMILTGSSSIGWMLLCSTTRGSWPKWVITGVRARTHVCQYTGSFPDIWKSITSVNYNKVYRLHSVTEMKRDFDTVNYIIEEYMRLLPHGNDDWNITIFSFSISEFVIWKRSNKTFNIAAWYALYLINFIDTRSFYRFLFFLRYIYCIFISNQNMMYSIGSCGVSRSCYSKSRDNDSPNDKSFATDRNEKVLVLWYFMNLKHVLNVWNYIKLYGWFYSMIVISTGGIEIMRFIARSRLLLLRPTDNRMI